MTEASLKPNPYRDSGPWGLITIGGMDLPGVVESVDGADKPEEWNVQKPSDKSGASSVWKGTQVADGIEIILALVTSAQFDRYWDVAAHLRPKIGDKPPTHKIENPIINFAGIVEVSCILTGSPKWVGETGKGFWRVKIRLVEVRPPKPANTGTAGGSNVKDIQKDAPDPDKDLQDRIADNTAELDKLGSEP